MKKRPENFVLLSIFSIYMIVLVISIIVVKLNEPLSDVYGYWRDSQNLQNVFNIYHLPGYPLLIALLNFLTLGILPPIRIMQVINLIALLVGALSVYKISLLHSSDTGSAALAMVLFALWPFVGITYSIQPLADAPALAMFLAGIYLLLRSRIMSGSALIGLSLTIHKGIWPFALVFVLAWLWNNRKNIKSGWLTGAFVLALPLMLIWVLGTIALQNPVWIMSYDLNASYSITSGMTLPFSGIIAALTPSSLKDIVRGSAVVGSFMLALICLFLSLKATQPWRTYGLAFTSVILFFCAAFSYPAQWYTMRFARLLVLPVGWFLPLVKAKYNFLSQKWVQIILIVLGIGLILSQIGFTLYLKTFFGIE